MLTNALDILRLLAESPEPLTATAISERIGLHTSNVSRTLRVLIEAGYVRKPSYHSFAPDLGLLALAGSAAANFPVCRRSEGVVKAMAERSGRQVTLAGLFQEQIVYLQRCAPGGEAVMAGVTSFPLHRSAVALRLLLEMPAERALALLEASKRRYGWERPTRAVPASPKGCLRAAKAGLVDEVLQLRGWQRQDSEQAAIAVSVPAQPLLALALDGGPAVTGVTIIDALKTGAAEIADALGD